MHTVRIKRGDTFECSIIFETDDEWATVAPFTSVTAKFKQGSRETILTVSVDMANRTFNLSATPAQTERWLTRPSGAASFDVLVTQAPGKEMSIPSSFNIPLMIIEGVTQ